MPDFIPSSDDAFTPWETHFADIFGGAPTTYGGTAADATALAALQSAWHDGRDAHVAAAAAARSARSDKDAARRNYEEAIRAIVRRVQAAAGVTDAMREELGIPVRDTARTPNLAAPATRPVAEIDTGESLRHVIHFRDEQSESKARPAGNRGAEIWVSIGVPPSGMVDGGSGGNMQFLALDTSTPYMAQYAESDAGKTAYYRLRWISTRGEIGPWSEVVAATIVA